MDMRYPEFVPVTFAIVVGRATIPTDMLQVFLVARYAWKQVSLMDVYGNDPPILELIRTCQKEGMVITTIARI